MQNTKLGALGGACIVSGTSIGAGMLALPVITGPSGYVPSIAVLILSWIAMTITGLLFVELSIWLKKEVNLLTMAETTLGKLGKAATWFVYLFFFYCLLVAYLVGGGNLLSDIYGTVDDKAQRILIFAAVFVSLITIGKTVVDPINRVLVAGLFIAYIGFVIIGFDSVDIKNLQVANWEFAKWSLPIALASFGFQGTVPTLCSWMGYDKKNIYKAVLCGTLITLAVYLVWQTLFLGIVPLHGQHGLIDTLNQGKDAVHPLQFFTKTPLVWTLGKVFAFCALATSFLGVGIGIMDFLRDGLHIERKGILRYCVLVFLSFGIPLSFALSYPSVFIKALAMAGGFGSTLLLGVLPVVMIWRAKYGLNQDLANGKFLKSRVVLGLVFIFMLFEIWIQFEATFKGVGFE